MWKKALKGIADWLKELVTRPKTIAAVFAGVLIAAGMPEPAAQMIGSTAGTIAEQIEAHQKPASKPGAGLIIDLSPLEQKP